MQQLSTFFETFDGRASAVWMGEHWEVPSSVAAIYLIFVFAGQRLMKQRNPLNLKPLVTVWNFLLASFSILGARVTVPYLFGAISQHPDTHWFFCTNATSTDYYYHGEVGAWAFLFGLSKIPELMDTVFLVLQKKPVIFLHWFHHFTVMLYCWHAWTVGAPVGIFFATMNYFVHAIMYSYYFLMCFTWGRKLVRRFAILITSLQIFQMIVGLWISVVAYHYLSHTTSSDGRQTASEVCRGADATNVKLGLAMYLSYLVLFSALFKRLYVAPTQRDAPGTRRQHGKVSAVPYPNAPDSKLTD